MKAEDWPETWPCRLLSLTEDEGRKRSTLPACSCSGQCRHVFLVLHILEQSAGVDINIIANGETNLEIVLRMWASDLWLFASRLRRCIHELVRLFDKLVSRYPYL